LRNTGLYEIAMATTQTKAMSSNGWITTPISSFFARNLSGEWGGDPTRDDSPLVVGTPDFNNNGSINWRKVKHRDISHTKLRPRQLFEGNILVEKSGGSDDQPAGRVVYCDKTVRGTCSNFVQLLTVDEKLHSRFIFYLLYYYYNKGLVYPFQQKTTGIINFKIREYFKTCLSLPESFSEQATIATIVSSVDEAINQSEILIAKLTRIKQGLMQDLLNRGIDEKGNIRSEQTRKFKDSPLGRIPEEWTGTTFRGISTVRQGLQIAISERFKEAAPNRHRYITIQFLGDPGRYTDYIEDPPRSVTCTTSDILLTRTGNMGQVVTDVEGVFHNNFFLIDFDRSRITKDYLKYFLQLNIIQKQFMQRAGITTIPDLKHKDFYDTPCWFPGSIDEQREITSILDKAHNLVGNEQDMRDKLFSVKRGLMEDLLTGKVRVNHLLKQ